MRQHQVDRSASSHDREYGRAFRRALAVSAVLHLALFMTCQNPPQPRSPFAAAGPRTGDDQAAAGGGMQALQLAEPPPEVIVPPPDPIPVPDITLDDQEPEPDPPTAEVAAISLEQLQGPPGEAEGPEQGPGLAQGTGTGDGGTAEEGRFRVVPPQPRGLVLPPGDRPSSAKGREIEVWVFVSEAGRVVPDSTVVRPSTGDRRYDSRLMEQAARWVFRPARKGGQVVAEWFRYTIAM